jgi:hypothetical protein
MLRAAAAVLILCAGVVACANPAETRAGATPAAGRYAVMANDVSIGHLRVTTSGDRVAIDFAVDDNGRGPKYRESLRLGPDGLPVEWHIEGTAWFGAPVQEAYSLRDGQAAWQTLNDSGSAALAAPALYVPNDASPWSYGMWTPALLRANGARMPALPGGTLRAEKLRDVEVGGEPLAAYAVWGVSSQPELVLLRPDGSLFGYGDGYLTVLPEGREADCQALTTLEQSLQRELLAKLAQAHVQRPDRPVYLRDVRVFDAAAGTVGEPTTVVVYRGRIASVRRDARPVEDGVVVDGAGGVLIPGLMDAHAHLAGWDGVYHVASGVTTVRDPGNDNRLLLDLVARIDAGEIIGPRVLRAGFLEGRSAFSANGGFVVDDLPVALDRVRWYADRGFRWIKIYNSMPPDWVAPIAAEAHRLGLRVMGHVPAFSSSERVIRDGYDEITHINQLLLSLVIDTQAEDTRTPFRFTALGERVGRLDVSGAPVQRLVRLMQERRIAIDPTVATFGPMLLAGAGQAAPTDTPWLDHMPVAVQRARRMPVLAMKPGDAALYRASWDTLLAMLKLLHEAGIVIVPGTDDQAGLMLHSELEAYAAAGIPNASVLQLATLGAARHFGLDHEVGSIEPGKRADLVLLGANPLEDMRHVRDVRLVLVGGDLVRPDRLYEAIGVEPFAKSAEVRAGADYSIACRSASISSGSCDTPR